MNLMLLVLLPLVARGRAVLWERRLWVSFALGLGFLTPFAAWSVAVYGSPLAPFLDLEGSAGFLTIPALDQ